MKEGLIGFAVFLVLLALITGISYLLFSFVYLIIILIPLIGVIYGFFHANKIYSEEVKSAKAGLSMLKPVAIMRLVKHYFSPQPAQLIYPFGEGWQVIDVVSENIFSHAHDDGSDWFRRSFSIKNRAYDEYDTFMKYFYWCRFYAFFIISFFYYLSLIFEVGIIFLIHLLALISWMLIVGFTISVLSIWNFAHSRYNKIFVRCPECHKQMAIPVYICPVCAEEHTRLWPSVYGIFIHTCNCGHKLITLDCFGRNKLARHCISCKSPMNNAIGRQINVHVPVVGGPSSGKSNFIFQSTRQFIDEYAPSRKIKAYFPDEKHLLNYETSKHLLSTGQVLTKTIEITPQAYNLSIKRRGDLIGRIAYIYDAAGEAYSSDDNIAQQGQYYGYIQGIIFTIDPFSIEHFAHCHEREISQIHEAVRPSSLNVMDSYSRMLSLMETSFKVKINEPFRNPIAIVITKTDALDLEFLIGRIAAKRFMRRNTAIRSESDAINILVEKFLIDNQMGNFVRDLKMHFENLKFFSCSALGRMPSPGQNTDYKPIGTLDPFLWILSQQGVINTTPERYHAIDKEDRRRATSYRNIFHQLSYYLWKSLIPYQEEKVNLCPRCGHHIPSWLSIHPSCFFYRAIFIILAFYTIMTGIIYGLILAIEAVYHSLQ